MICSRANPLTQADNVPLNLEEEEWHEYVDHLTRRVNAAAEFHRQAARTLLRRVVHASPRKFMEFKRALTNPLKGFLDNL